MKYHYEKDLDELIIFRCDEFSEERLPYLKVAEIEAWNKYNEDILILPYTDDYLIDKAGEEFLFSKAEGHNIYYRVIYKKIEVDNQPYILMSRIPMIETKDLLMNLFAQYGLIFFILLFSLAIVQRMVSKKLWSAFYSTLGKIENYNLEQEDIPQFGTTNIKEFDRLNVILSTLICNNLTVYRQQKEFIENASHEMQTPLAVFQSKLDILLQDSNLTQSQSETIQLLYDTSARLARLNKNLLLLAKIENLQFKDTGDIDFVNVLNCQLDYLKGLAEHNGLNVFVEIGNSLIVDANSTLLECLINNLTINAIRHNIDNGSVFITVIGKVFRVSNTGSETPLNKEKLFRRVSLLSKEKNGNGLGLPIISQICKFHGWGIEYGYNDRLHVFTVCFE